jgi:hypothetical protein
VLNHKIEQSMKKVTLFVGMIAMAAFLSTTAVAQDKAKDTKPATTQTTPAKADAKTPASTGKKDACKPGCTMHKDGGKCCDKDKKTTTPEKK